MGASYTKRGKRWQARVRIKGKPSRSKSFDTKKEAQTWALATLQDMKQDKGENPYIMTYLRQYADERKAMLTRSNSKQGWEHMVHVASLFFEKDHPRTGERLKDVDRKRYKAFALYIGRHFSESSNRRTHQSIKAAFEDAKATGLIKENPAAFVPTRTITGVASKERTEGAELTREETQKMIEYLETTHLKRAHVPNDKNAWYEPGYYVAILTALMTGAREGEICGLRWKDVKLGTDRRTGEKVAFIDINHQIDTIAGHTIEDFRKDGEAFDKGTGFDSLSVFKPLKTKSSRRKIKIPLELLDTYKRLAVRHWKNSQEDPLFKTRAFKTMGRSSLSLYTHKLLNELDIHHKNFHFHSLRHVHVAILLDRGMPIDAISRRLGHAHVQITLKKYAYTVKEKQDQDETDIVDNLTSLMVDNGDETKK